MEYFNPFIAPYDNKIYSVKHGLKITKYDNEYIFSLHDESDDAVKAFEELYIKLGGYDMDMNEFMTDHLDHNLIKIIDNEEQFFYSYKYRKPFECFHLGHVKTTRDLSGSLRIKAFNPHWHLKPVIEALGIPKSSIRTCTCVNDGRISFQSFNHVIPDGFIDTGKCFDIKPEIRIQLMKLRDIYTFKCTFE